jgi:hypothetical protein
MRLNWGNKLGPDRKTCDSLMTGAQGSTRETSSMIITFPRDEGERSAGSQLKEGQTG